VWVPVRNFNYEASPLGRFMAPVALTDARLVLLGVRLFVTIQV